MNDAISTDARRGPGVAVTASVIVAMGVLIGLTAWGQYGTGTPMPLVELDIAAGVVSLALLPLLLRRPVIGTVAITVLAAVSWGATPPATAGALYVAHSRRFPVAVAVGAVGVVAHATRGVWRPIPGLPIGWYELLVVATYAALVGWGALSQARRALIGSLRERAERAEAEQGRRVAEARAAERRRIAGEMHDVLAHRLSLLATYAGALEYRPDAPPERLSQAATVVRTGVHEALGELRDVIAVLREDEPAGGAGPQPGLSELPALLDECREAGTVVELRNALAEEDTVPATVGRAAYRVIREALTNARKHAGGQPVLVVLGGEPGAGLTVEVSNPLPTGASAPLVPGSGTGLVGLTERVRLAGGMLDHHMGAGEFCLRGWLPWPR